MLQVGPLSGLSAPRASILLLRTPNARLYLYCNFSLWFFLPSLLKDTLSLLFSVACRTCLPTTPEMLMLSLAEEILFWWSPQIPSPC